MNAFAALKCLNINNHSVNLFYERKNQIQTRKRVKEDASTGQMIEYKSHAVIIAYSTLFAVSCQSTSRQFAAHVLHLATSSSSCSCVLM